MAREVDLGLVVGAQGPKGDKGDPGKDGTGVNIKGSVSDETNLPGTGQSGDAYLDNSGNLWVYVGSGGDSTNGLFKNAGNIKGPKGDQGEQGPKGDTGQAGADGEDGITPTIGENGNWFLGASDTGKPSRGATGAQGPKGDTGDQGPAGQDGEVGPQGPKGDKGDTGAQGPAGKDGQTPTFSIDENGHLIASFEE